MPDKPKSKNRPIMVAVDFSPYSESALLWAARTAHRFEAPLVVLHVVHDPSSAPGYYQHAKKRKKHVKRIQEAAEEMMATFLDEMTGKHPKLLAKLRQRLVVGLPITRILEVADDIDAQLIVMGSRGRTGLPHLLLGSKSEKVAQLSPVPVTIVKQAEPAEDSSD